MWNQVVVLLCGILAGVFLSAVVLVYAGVSLNNLYTEFVVSVFSSPANISAVLVRSAPLIIVGVSAAVAFRANFWNIGIEGQMMCGAMASTYFSIYDIGPDQSRIFIMLIASAVGGMAWIVIPVILKIRLGVNEIISTLLLNYVAFNFVLHKLYGSWKDPITAFPNSAQFDAVERLPRLGWQNLTYTLPLAVLLALVCWWFLNFSRFGFFTKFTNANEKTAHALGFPVIKVIVVTALLSGALSGIGGFVVTAGIEYRLTQSFFVGYGFSGILIAFIAQNNPLGAILVAFFIAILFVVGQSLQVFYQIPGSMVQFIQAIVVITVAGSEFFLRHRICWIR